MPTFAGPTDNQPFSGLLSRWHYPRGRTVYRYNGTWYEGNEFPWGSDQVVGLRDADVVPVADRPGGERTDGTDRDRYLFLGGRVYTVSAAVATTLAAAGYSTVDESPTPSTWARLTGTWADLVGSWGDL